MRKMKKKFFLATLSVVMILSGCGKSKTFEKVEITQATEVTTEEEMKTEEEIDINKDDGYDQLENVDTGVGIVSEGNNGARWMINKEEAGNVRLKLLHNIAEIGSLTNEETFAAIVDVIAFDNPGNIFSVEEHGSHEFMIQHDPENTSNFYIVYTVDRGTLHYFEFTMPNADNSDSSKRFMNEILDTMKFEKIDAPERDFMLTTEQIKSIDDDFDRKTIDFGNFSMDVNSELNIPEDERMVEELRDFLGEKYDSSQAYIAVIERGVYYDSKTGELKTSLLPIPDGEKLYDIVESRLTLIYMPIELNDSLNLHEKINNEKFITAMNALDDVNGIKHKRIDIGNISWLLMSGDDGSISAFTLNNKKIHLLRFGGNMNLLPIVEKYVSTVSFK